MQVAGDGWNQHRLRNCPEIRPITEPCRLFRLMNINTTDNVAQYAAGWFVSHPGSVLVGCPYFDPEGWTDMLSAYKSDRLSRKYCLRFQNNIDLVTVADHTSESPDRSRVLRTRMQSTGLTLGVASTN